jgi:hypothetical protein
MACRRTLHGVTIAGGTQVGQGSSHVASRKLGGQTLNGRVGIWYNRVQNSQR